MARKTVELFDSWDFGIVHDRDEHPKKIDFKLHNHKDIYETVLFLNGDCSFYVEGNTYLVHPNDLILARPFEFHHIHPLSDIPYERIILYLKEEYFQKHYCEKFLAIFQDRPLGINNLISTQNSIIGARLISAIQNLLHFISNSEYMVADHAIIEILYWLNQKNSFHEILPVKDTRIREIILYLNTHITENISLEQLASAFFLSKFYLCRLFKANTGCTITQYINQKRILLASQFHSKGANWLTASVNAGFHDYSYFYRVYRQLTGKRPGK